MEEYEKQRFIQWLEIHIRDNASLIKETEKLGPIGKTISQSLERERSACIIVRDILTNTQAMAIGPG